MRRWVAVYAAVLVVGFVACSLPALADSELTLPPSISDRIDRLARDEVHNGRTPGLAIGVIEDGRLVYARGFGFATLAKHAPMTADTEFYTGGLTMQFTAAAVLLLVQDGKVSLDDRVVKYVPEFHLGTDVTIAQLLSQTSGLPNYSSLPNIASELTRTIKMSDLLASIDRLNPVARPGSVYANNPVNYLLAGLIVERASGVPLSDYLEQHIFLPLVMNHTFLAGDNGISPSHATGYTRSPQGWTTAPVWDPAWLGGATGLVSTIYDLAKWDIEMPVLMRVDAVRTMFTPSANSGPTHYGMGWVIDRRGGKTFVWSNGEISGYRAMNALLPEEHMGVIVFSNADSLHGENVTGPEELGARILDILVPPTSTHLDNAIVMRAKEWLTRLASRQLDRSELTTSFSAYLSDDLVARENFAALGPLLTIVPISSTAESNGDTMYEFLVGFPRAQYHYEFEVTKDGKINGISLKV
ncbi:MAG TPA: serine hydrolase domain-containing protein [Candidatus Cybelea sp.]|jgi:CubicO group peptidase (beta-lactamase class C family)|nr:serine hydrolase domain-containing protein [Candidatus Cybelea sp.]